MYIYPSPLIMCELIFIPIKDGNGSGQIRTRLAIENLLLIPLFARYTFKKYPLNF